MVHCNDHEECEECVLYDYCMNGVSTVMNHNVYYFASIIVIHSDYLFLAVT
jgi:hypothetical protein